MKWAERRRWRTWKTWIPRRPPPSLSMPNHTLSVLVDVEPTPNQTQAAATAAQQIAGQQAPPSGAASSCHPQPLVEYDEIGGTNSASASAKTSSVSSPPPPPASSGPIGPDGDGRANPDSSTAHPVPSYQNQTAADIERGLSRARVDSIGSYGSGGSEDALLPPSQQPTSPTAASSSTAGGPSFSPRRVNRENRPLLSSGGGGGGVGGGGSSRSQYEEIEDALNTFPGEEKGLACNISYS